MDKDWEKGGYAIILIVVMLAWFYYVLVIFSLVTGDNVIWGLSTMILLFPILKTFSLNMLSGKNELLKCDGQPVSLMRRIASFVASVSGFLTWLFLSTAMATMQSITVTSGGYYFTVASGSHRTVIVRPFVYRFLQPHHLSYFRLLLALWLLMPVAIFIVYTVTYGWKPTKKEVL